MKQKPNIKGREKRHETKANINRREKRRETKANIIEGKNGVKQNPPEEKPVAVAKRCKLRANL